MILDKKFSLGFFPTALQPLTRLSGRYSGYNIFIKRDDNTGLACGGNKTRKLEYLIGDAIAHDCDTVITAGAQQSNHCRQTAAACAIAGLECHLLLGGDKPQHFGGNLLLSHLLGAKIFFTGEYRKGEGIETVKSELSSNGKKVYVIPYGGSNITGALGFANAMGELKNQMTEMNLSLDYIFFASSSGGMQSGLMLGKDLFDLDVELMPVGIDKEGMHGKSLQEIVVSIVNDGSNVLGIQRQYTISDVALINDFNEAGYGVVTDNERSAIRELAMTEGILLDPVYTGRAFFGMTEYLKKGRIKPGSNVLFWHTGGIPAIFHHADQMMG
jgi:D-cysteine desulfhydrase family pyridoxal phosphate-dependent enzyme